MATEPHYKIIVTNSGWHVASVAGNAEYTLSGQVLKSEEAALKAIKSVARMHSPVGIVTISNGHVYVWLRKYVWLREYPTPTSEQHVVIPIRYSDRRKPTLARRGRRALDRLVGTPKSVQRRAQVDRG
jgi:uncharacterized protein YegP (UPF0339 family)